MTSTRKWALLTAAIAIVFATSVSAQAVLISFTVDQIGSGMGTTPINPSAADIGKYEAGSFLALSGNVAGSLSGISFSGNFSAQKAASGAWSTGNPGSLTSYYTGNLLANVTPTSVSFPGGSSIDASNYTSVYPVKGGTAQALSPALGGGTSGNAGTPAPANYGVSLKVTAVIFTAASGTAALRNSVMDVIQNTGVSSVPLGAPVGGVQTFTAKNNVQPTIASTTFDYNLVGSVVLGNTVPNLFGTTNLTNASAPESGTQLGSLKTVVVDPVRQIYDYYIVVPTTATTTQVITGSTPVTITVTTTGQVAAYALNVQIPEPATFVLAGFAAVPLGFLAWRRRKRA
jgi:hypothetical protein